MRPVIEHGQVWRRRVELHDGWDKVEICGEIPNDGTREREWTIRQADAFSETLASVESGITEHCTLIAEATPGA
jgi:hypothetical protein